MNYRQLDMILGYLNEGIQIDIDKYLNEAGNNDILYHGSHINIKGNYIIPKNKSHEDDDYVFATPDRNFALCFSGNPWHDGMINMGYYNNQLYMIEKGEGIFNNTFNTDGYVYKLMSTNFSQRTRTIYISKSKEKIISRTHIPNVLNELEKSNIKLYYYPNKPSWYKEDY